MKTYRTRSPPPPPCFDDAQRPPKLLVDPPDLQRRELLWRSRGSPHHSFLLARRRRSRRRRRDDNNLLRLVLGTTANTDDNTCTHERDMSVELRCRGSTLWVVWRGGGLRPGIATRRDADADGRLERRESKQRTPDGPPDRLQGPLGLGFQAGRNPRRFRARARVGDPTEREEWHR